MGSIGSDISISVDTVAIIGAGPSGIAAAKYLLAERCFAEIVIFEQRANVGGLWNYVPCDQGLKASAAVPQTDPHVGPDQPVVNDTKLDFMSPVYDALETNIPRGLMGFSDHDWPAETQLFPKHHQVLQYIEKYAEDVRHLINWTTQVIEVKPTTSGKWSIATQVVESSIVRKHVFDAVIVANGHFNVHAIPPVEGMREWHQHFPGSITHSKFYRNAEEYAEKKVVIVGNSASGIDIGSQVRTACRRPLIQSTTSPSAIESDLPNHQINKPEIVAYHPESKTIRFADGSKESDVDAILYCTGYLYSFPFLDSLHPPVISTGERVQHLYKHIFYQPQPTLSFMVLNQRVIPFPTAEAQAAVIARVFAGRLMLPPPSEMRQWEDTTLKSVDRVRDFHLLRFPKDADYINEMHAWAMEAKYVERGQDGGIKQGKQPPFWNEEAYWVRERFPAIKQAYQAFGTERHEKKTLQDVGFDPRQNQKQYQTYVIGRCFADPLTSLPSNINADDNLRKLIAGSPLTAVICFSRSIHIMSRSMCLRCLSRSLSALEQPLLHNSTTSRASFSTSPVFAAVPAKAKKGVVVAKKGSGGLRLRKNVRASTAKPPAPGERRAIRKRVVLSNTNALEVQLARLDRGNASVNRLEGLTGRILAFDNATIDKLRALDAFKTTQGWALFKTAATLIREDTVQIAKTIEQAESSKATMRLVLLGEKGSGKSVLQLQALCIAQQRGWILIHVPEAQELSAGTTAYQPSVDALGKTQYVQPHLTAKLLANILNANRTILEGLNLSKEYKLPVPVAANTSIARLIELGARDPTIAWPIWQVALQELTAASQKGQGLQRPPVLFSLDNLAHVMRQSEYVDSDLHSIHAHELAFVSSFNAYLNGSMPMRNGGVVLAAVSGSNRPATPTLDFVLAERLATKQKTTQPVWDPYAVRDTSVDEALRGIDVHKTAGLTKDEAKSAMEYYALSGIYRESISDALVAEKWSISGGGIIGELERSCVRQKY